MTSSMIILLLLAVCLANWPFISSRWFGAFPLKNKHFVHQFTEWLVAYLLVGILAYVLESRAGAAQQQGTTFYVVTIIMFAVFAFPAFSWRYFWHNKHKE
ncbi:DUF2818 family protein [Stenoxybacter acetivorans]|uniref:DUF2818 family protein n=1 Tax=Stenoxybacter acetivorans TaxID=422441 RepID=UPI0005699419|nr:DUF2818 family protein [Stenoxybacter acetivorans]